MRYVIAYDIADERRRARLAAALLDFGRRIEESVFLASVDEELAAEMRQRIQTIIELSEDCVHVFALCGACDARTEVYGRAELPEDKSFYVV